MEFSRRVSGNAFGLFTGWTLMVSFLSHRIEEIGAGHLVAGVSRLIAVAVPLALASISPVLRAHPAHAKPVRYPYVVGFERFYTDLDSPDHLAEGGLILLNELNCVACHEPPEKMARRLSGRPGTSLEGVGSRFDHLDLEMMIRNPRFVKTDTIMPSLFSGPDRDLEEIEALKHFLATLQTDLPRYPEGDIDAGRLLYHRVGCVACHAPEVDFRPPWVPANVEMFLTSLPSVPMNLADRYPREVLIDLIRDPCRYRPSGRMPRFELTLEEAVDIGTYLNSTPKPELPEPLLAALAARNEFVPEPALVEKGKELFAVKNCVACHHGVVAADPILASPLDELDTVEPAGCLAERPPGFGVPAYGLDDLQKKAIIEALKRIGTPPADTPDNRIDWAFSTQNCYSCHSRGGKGGPETARVLFFTVDDPDAVTMGQWASHPPSLSGVGKKLTDSWLDQVMHQGGDAVRMRRYQSARMPVYRAEDTGGILRDLKELDRNGERAVEKVEGDPDNGRQLLGIEGRNCVSCHGIDPLPPPDGPSVSLSPAPDRLSFNYFQSLLEDPQGTLPGVPMKGEVLSREAIRDIWAYLSGNPEEDLPPGLLQPDVTELIPVERPIILRGGLEGWFEDGLVIGFPSGLNLAFDIPSCRWRAAWRGRFIDPGNDWKSDRPANLEPLQHPIALELWRPEIGIYEGYRLVEGGLPEILYRNEKGERVVDRIADGGARVVKITGNSGQEAGRVIEESIDP